jgi:LPXTG-motif cell wall-anchored protein
MFKKVLFLLVMLVILFSFSSSVNAFPWPCWPTPQPTIETTEEATPEITIEITETIETTPEITPTVDPTADVTEEVTPEITPIVTGTDLKTLEPTQTVTPEITPTVEKFPNTGEKENIFALLIGISLFLSGLLFIFRKKLGLFISKR